MDVKLERIPYYSDVDPIKELLDLHHEWWDIKEKIPNSPWFAQTKSIQLRFPKIYRENNHFVYPGDPLESFDTKVYTENKEIFEPVIIGLFNKLHGSRLGRVVLTRLDPLGEVKPHCDAPPNAGYYNRYQIMIRSHDDIFMVDEEEIITKTGDCFRFDNRREHSVINKSPEHYRIALTIDIRLDSTI